MTVFATMILEWAPLICWLIAMGCFIVFPTRMRILEPSTSSLRRRAVLGTIFFFAGITLFLVQFLLKWLTQGHPL